MQPYKSKYVNLGYQPSQQIMVVRPAESAGEYLISPPYPSLCNSICNQLAVIITLIGLDYSYLLRSIICQRQQYGQSDLLPEFAQLSVPGGRIEYGKGARKA